MISIEHCYNKMWKLRQQLCNLSTGYYSFVLIAFHVIVCFLSMIMGVNDDLRVILRWDLNAVLFHDQVEHAAKIIIDDQARVARIVKENHVDYAVKASKDLFGEISSIFGPQAINESIPMNSDSEFHSEVFDRSSHMMSSVKQRIVERQSKFHPSTKCIMNGLLVSVKNHEKPEAVFRDFLGFKKTKRRWYELNFVSLSWYGRWR